MSHDPLRPAAAAGTASASGPRAAAGALDSEARRLAAPAAAAAAGNVDKVPAVAPLTVRGDVSAFAYQLVSHEAVREFSERGAYGALEQLGFEIGYRFVERFVRGHTRFSNTLEIVKFLCKDLWNAMFGKNVDKLQTNHKGTFVLHDNQHMWVANLDVDYKSDESLDEAKKFLILPCGLVRGALSNLGVKSTVRAEFSALPACCFNVQIHDLAAS